MKCDGEYTDYLTTGKQKIEFKAPRSTQETGHIQ